MSERKQVGVSWVQSNTNEIVYVMYKTVAQNNIKQQHLCFCLFWYHIYLVYGRNVYSNAML